MPTDPNTAFLKGLEDIANTPSASAQKTTTEQAAPKAVGRLQSKTPVDPSGEERLKTEKASEYTEESKEALEAQAEAQAAEQAKQDEIIAQQRKQQLRNVSASDMIKGVVGGTIAGVGSLPVNAAVATAEAGGKLYKIKKERVYAANLRLARENLQRAVESEKALNNRVNAYQKAHSKHHAEIESIANSRSMKKKYPDNATRREMALKHAADVNPEIKKKISMEGQQAYSKEVQAIEEAAKTYKDNIQAMTRQHKAAATLPTDLQEKFNDILDRSGSDSSPINSAIDAVKNIDGSENKEWKERMKKMLEEIKEMVAKIIETLRSALGMKPKGQAPNQPSM